MSIFLHGLVVQFESHFASVRHCLIVPCVPNVSPLGSYNFTVLLCYSNHISILLIVRHNLIVTYIPHVRHSRIVPYIPNIFQLGSYYYTVLLCSSNHILILLIVRHSLIVPYIPIIFPLGS